MIIGIFIIRLFLRKNREREYMKFKSEDDWLKEWDESILKLIRLILFTSIIIL
jgi:hypothetical protein